MQVENPLFVIPPENAREAQKPGGGEPPKFIGDPSKFEGHKRARVSEMDNVLKVSETTKPKVSNPESKFFFEVELHPKALSKSMQPRELLKANHIDIYAQKKEATFLASSSKENFHSFRDEVSKFSVDGTRNESAYLSAITKISTIPKEDIIINNECLEEEKSRVFLYLQDVISEADGKLIAQAVENKSRSQSEFFVAESGSKIIYGTFSASFLDEISNEHPNNPFQKVEKSIDFILPQDTEINFTGKELTINPPTLDARVAVVDSGVKSVDVYKDFIAGAVDFIKNNAHEDLSHGTMVGTRVIFGNDIESQLHNGVLNAQARILDIKVMRESAHETHDKDVVAALKKVLEDPQYDDTRVFNLSLGGSDVASIHRQNKTYFTRELDALAKKHDALFIVAAGNQKVYWEEKDSYPDCLFEHNSVITPPADILNGISVGSVADTDSSRSVAANTEPSPFTRTGLIGGLRKPDLAHFGGNVDKFGTVAGIGVKGFSTDSDRLHEGVGTSYAAPLVSQTASQILAYLHGAGWDRATGIDLTKALLLHSADYNLPHGSNINPDDLSRLVGFGIPDLSRAIDCTKNQATFIYTGTLANFKKKDEKDEIKPNKHKIKFIVPTELEPKTRGEKKTVRVRGTLIYTPQISATGDFDYAQAEISLNMRYFNSNGTMQSGALTRNPLDYRYKWNPVKSFERSYKSFKGGEWEIWLEMTTRGDADEKYAQNYALVVTVEDATPDPNNRVDLHEIVKSQHRQYNLLQLKARARVSSRG